MGRKRKRNRQPSPSVNYYIRAEPLPELAGPSFSRHSHFTFPTAAHGHAHSTYRSTPASPKKPKSALQQEDFADLIDDACHIETAFEAQLHDPDYINFLAELELDSVVRVRSQSVWCIAGDSISL
jgi:hypothetical protein